MKKILRNSLLAYIITSVVGLPFCTNMALADALDKFNESSLTGVDFGTLLQDGVPTKFDSSSGQVSSGGNDVIKYEGAKDGMSDVKGAYGNKTALGGLVSNAANRLDAENSDAGNAYRTLNGGIHQQRPNLKNDVMVKNGQSVLRESFNDPQNAGCYTTIQSQTIDAGSTHLEDLKYCDRVTIKEPQCKIWREIEMVRPLTFISGDGRGYDVDLSTFEIILGIDGDDYLKSKNRCGYYKTDIKIRVNNPKEIKSAIITSIKYDDRIRLKMGSSVIFTGPDANFNTAASSCELGASVTAAGIDVTNHFTSRSINEMVDVSIEVLYQGGGEGFAKLEIKYKEPNQIIHQEPEGCLDEIKADPNFLGGPHPNWKKSSSVDDQASNGYWQCKNATNAYVINIPSGGTYTITPSDYAFLGPLFPDEPVAPPAPICFEAELRKLGTYTECQDEEGNNPDLCTTRTWKDGDVVDTCATLKNNPDCTFVETKCDESSSGVCTAYKDYYDCGTDVKNTTISNTETVVCPGNISCMGESCGVTRGTEKNARFNDAAVAMEVVKNSNMDGKCDQNTGGDCRIFGGELFTCKKVLGGMQDCCQMDLPPGPSLADYMILTKSTWSLTKDTALGKDLAQMGHGAWDSFSGAATDLASEIGKPLVSAWDSFVGTAAGSADAIGAGIDVVATGAEAATAVTKTAMTETGSAAISDQLTNYVVEWATEVFGEAVSGTASSLFVENAAGNMVLNVVGNMVAAFLSIVMWIYLIYQIITILVALIWPCTDDEFTLASKKDMRVCHFLETEKKKSLGMNMSEIQKFCCFGSPFARIIHEQTRDKPEQPDLHKPWGKGPTLDCTGFTMNQFSTIDFGKVDLSEWLALLRLAEMTPTDAETLNNELGSDKAGSRKLGENSFSATSMERAKALINQATGGDDDALDNRRNELSNNAREDALINK